MIREVGLNITSPTIVVSIGIASHASPVNIELEVLTRYRHHSKDLGDFGKTPNFIDSPFAWVRSAFGFIIVSMF